MEVGMELCPTFVKIFQGGIEHENLHNRNRINRIRNNDANPFSCSNIHTVAIASYPNKIRMSEEVKRMATESVNIISLGAANVMSVLPAVIGALLVLLIGWIIGRLVGKAVRILLDKVFAVPAVSDSDFGRSIKKTGITIGSLGDVATRCLIYLVAVLAAVDILNLDYLSQFMEKVVEYIPHVIVFIIILVVGIVLIDYFIDTLHLYAKNENIELVGPVTLSLRIFLYFVVVMLALSQLLLDLTIIYTIVTPIFWGIGIGIGVAIAIVVWFGMKNRSEEIMNKMVEVMTK